MSNIALVAKAEAIIAKVPKVGRFKLSSVMPANATLGAVLRGLIVFTGGNIWRKLAISDQQPALSNFRSAR